MSTEIPLLNWAEQSPEQQIRLLERPVQAVSAQLRQQVTGILQQVRQSGDQALLELTAQLDGVPLPQPELPQERVAELAAQTPVRVQRAIDAAWENIRRFHEAQQPENYQLETQPGVLCEQRFTPLKRVGLYIPGGSASLPSTVLMLGVPAQLAGCQERILVSPPAADGSLNPAICYAAQKCGITQVILAGGAQAVAALAYGTQSIQPVAKIFGPGNSYVTEAKQQVAQEGGGPAIDLPAGPSELLVLADDTAEPTFVAADLLSQAEHGPDSQVLLLSPSPSLLQAVRTALLNQLADLPRADIARQALHASRLIQTRDIAEAIAVSELYAPEHLSLQLAEPTQWLPQLTRAGSIFVGHYTPESGGDYATGTNHVLPTYGFARNYNSLGLVDFYRRYTVQQVSAQGLAALGETITTLAEEEQLQAHARAVTLRLSSARFASDLQQEESS